LCRLIARVCSHVVHGVVVGWAVFELMRARVCCRCEVATPWKA
jgi:hypothetical protein